MVHHSAQITSELYRAKIQIRKWQPSKLRGIRGTIPFNAGAKHRNLLMRNGGANGQKKPRKPRKPRILKMGIMLTNLQRTLTITLKNGRKVLTTCLLNRKNKKARYTMDELTA